MRGKSLPVISLEQKRDAYGFAEEEEERSEQWKNFLQRLAESVQSAEDLGADTPNDAGNDCEQSGLDKCHASEEVGAQKEPVEKEKAKIHRTHTWSQIRSSLAAIEQLMSHRVKKRKSPSYKEEECGRSGNRLAPIEEVARHSKEEESEEEFYDMDRSDVVQEEAASGDGGNADSAAKQEPFFPSKEELECLVRGGVPMALRGELWQAFVGVTARRVEGYYNDLLTPDTDTDESDASLPNDTVGMPKRPQGGCVPEKWKTQIEKDLPRTFPGHPALDGDGRNALRHLLTAYARHNPSVGYCQAMNFFGGLLLLLMPEENAFWTLLGIIDDYFDGYYSEEMIESQVDQLVLEELVREKFPKLVHHLDYLGVQVAWVTGPWFLSIFTNMLPWESGPAVMTTKDAGDAVTLLQSLAGSTFDSSQLVLTACMGYQAVDETILKELRKKHRPAVIAAMEERSRGLNSWNDSKGLASKLYSFKHDPGSILTETNSAEVSDDMQTNGDLHALKSGSTDIEGYLNSLTVDTETDSLPDLKEQVTWLKIELCKLLEEKRSAVLRAEELETAFMEMIKQDNRRLLSAKVEQLEKEVSKLRQALADKQEQERAILQVLMRMEQEQKVTEDVRISAEQDAAAQKYATHVLQEKYEEAISALAQMEKRAVMAETMLEATLQYQSGQVKAQQPHSPSKGNIQGKPSNTEESFEGKTSSIGQSPKTPNKDLNGHQD
ncbi:TBC1 domain family member 8B [Cocos nucifera]|uniref:TBC1 domain family member 8B n=1 Tax=Cocos nucifera TaxID=13894 RepID=A0A8K0I7M2_COCNU|nr:TBC1 domain family member 8B [Cocos nucifera]